MVDQMLTPDMTHTDAMVIDDSVDVEVDRMDIPDQDVIKDIEMTEMEMSISDMELEPDMTAAPENFILTSCMNGVIQDSGRRIIDGMEQQGDPLTCRLEGSKWLRIDPLSQVLFSTTSPNSHIQNRDQGIASVHTDYTYFLMQSEVTFNDYQGQCQDVTLPDDVDSRINQATCRAPMTLANMNDACATQLQSDIQIAIDDTTLNLSPDESQLPMNCVPWEDAAQFCRRIGGRLPTEVEWEMAATYGREIFPRSWPPDQGLDEYLCQYANIKGNGDSSCTNFNPLNFSIRPVCWGEQNPGDDGEYQLCDMSGNVAEWVLDDFMTQNFDNDLDGSPRLTTSEPHLCPDATGGNEPKKVTRGGSANQGARQIDLYDVYLTSRSEGSCRSLDAFTGFRCVISPKTYDVSPWNPDTKSSTP